MNKETENALRASIAKWERNVQCEDPEDMLLHWQACPLCELFFLKSCKGCPVAEHTGRTNCNDTPYHDVMVGENPHEDAQREVDFLKSLLPR